MKSIIIICLGIFFATSSSQILLSAGDNLPAFEIPDPSRAEDRSLLKDQVSFMSVPSGDSAEFLLPMGEGTNNMGQELTQDQSSISVDGSTNMNFKETNNANLDALLTAQANVAIGAAETAQDQSQNLAQDALEAQALNLINAREQGKIEPPAFALEAQAKALIENEERLKQEQKLKLSSEVNLEGKKIKIDHFTEFEFEGHTVKGADILNFYNKFRKLCGPDFSICSRIISDNIALQNKSEEHPHKTEEISAPRLKAKPEGKRIEWETPMIKGRGYMRR